MKTTKGSMGYGISKGYMVGDNRGVFTCTQMGVLIGVTVRVTGVIDENRQEL